MVLGAGPISLGSHVAYPVSIIFPFVSTIQTGTSLSTGTGEHIVRENLARKLCDAFDPEREDNDAHEILRLGLEGFWSTCQRQAFQERRMFH